MEPPLVLNTALSSDDDNRVRNPADRNAFFVFSAFLERGSHYIIKANLKTEDSLSPASGVLGLEACPTSVPWTPRFSPSSTLVTVICWARRVRELQS